MGTIVKQGIITEIQKYGDVKPSLCFNCGNCTALCTISKEQTAFPRKIIRFIQLGLKNKLLKAPEPWLCDYCGDCNSKCPRGAKPGEIMLSTRRYLMSEYDWTGITRKFNTSKYWELGSIFLVSIFVFLLFLLSGSFDRINSTQDSMSVFAPFTWIQFGILLLFLILAFLLLSIALRMYYFMIVQDNQKIPHSLYLTELKTVFLSFGNLNCPKKRNYIKNLILVTSSATIILLFVVLFAVFQTNRINWYWTSILGYYATFTIMYVSLSLIFKRILKKEEILCNSTNWYFIILLFFTGFSYFIFLEL